MKKPPGCNNSQALVNNTHLEHYAVPQTIGQQQPQQQSTINNNNNNNNCILRPAWCLYPLLQGEGASGSGSEAQRKEEPKLSIVL
jgi:hypothetical protein